MSSHCASSFSQEIESFPTLSKSEETARPPSPKAASAVGSIT